MITLAVAWCAVGRVEGLQAPWTAEEKYRFTPQPQCDGCDEAVPDDSWRRLIVVGDLHGDYGRMVRLLREAGLVEVDASSGQVGWVQHLEADVPPTDVVFVGDYVDWRREALEMGPNGEAVGNTGSMLVLRALRALVSPADAASGVSSGSLFGSSRRLATSLPTGVTVTFLAGNHDLMMLDAAELVVGEGEAGSDVMAAAELARLAVPSTTKAVWAQAMEGLGPTGQMRLHKFYHWWTQGGAQTAEGFGGIEAWAVEMRRSEGSLGDWLRSSLALGVRVGDTHISHTLADDSSLWSPVEVWGSGADGASTYCALRTDYTWGRGLWNQPESGVGAEILTDDKLVEALGSLNATRMIVGHTQKSTRNRPWAYREGRIINVDQHGISGSAAFSDLIAPPAHRPAEQHIITHGALPYAMCK